MNVRRSKVNFQAPVTKQDLEDLLVDIVNALAKALESYPTTDELDERLKNFATKEDLKRFATKDDLKQFATKDDLQKAIAPLATKRDLAVVDQKVDTLTLEVKELKKRVFKIALDTPNRREFEALKEVVETKMSLAL